MDPRGRRVPLGGGTREVQRPEPGRCARGRGSAGAALRGEGREESELGRA